LAHRNTLAGGNAISAYCGEYTIPDINRATGATFSVGEYDWDKQSEQRELATPNGPQSVSFDDFEGEKANPRLVLKRTSSRRL
jgi:hypothetical protein